MITRAKLSHLGVPALKVRRFASTIKGEKVERALAILDLQPSPTCQYLGKLLRSALANAVNNHQLSADYLYVSNVLVNQGPTMKRIRPRARGRAYRVLKRSSHVTIELDLVKERRQAPTIEEAEEAKPAVKPRKKSAEKPAAKEKAKKAPAKKSTAAKKPAGAKKSTPAAKAEGAKKETGKSSAKRSVPRKAAAKPAKQAKEKE